jgi:chromosomal replication initiation ATPase DnaA
MKARQLPLPFAPPGRAAAALPFFAATSNHAALAWLEAPDTWPEGRLLLWGDAGLGKTHLLQAWAPTRGAAYVGGAGLRWPMPLPAGVAIDDADLAPEAALLHLLNEAAATRRTTLMAARTPPAGWATRLPDLASRLRAVTTVRIEAADDALLRAILLRLCAERQLRAPEAVQEFLLAHLPRTPAALQEAAARLDRAALASGGRVTRALAAAVVDEMAAIWHAGAS